MSTESEDCGLKRAVIRPATSASAYHCNFDAKLKPIRAFIAANLEDLLLNIIFCAVARYANDQFGDGAILDRIEAKLDEIGRAQHFEKLKYAL